MFYYFFNICTFIILIAHTSLTSMMNQTYPLLIECSPTKQDNPIQAPFLNSKKVHLDNENVTQQKTMEYSKAMQETVDRCIGTTFPNMFLNITKGTLHNNIFFCYMSYLKKEKDFFYKKIDVIAKPSQQSTQIQTNQPSQPNKSENQSVDHNSYITEEEQNDLIYLCTLFEQYTLDRLGYYSCIMDGLKDILICPSIFNELKVIDWMNFYNKELLRTNKEISDNAALLNDVLKKYASNPKHLFIKTPLIDQHPKSVLARYARLMDDVKIKVGYLSNFIIESTGSSYEPINKLLSEIQTTIKKLDARIAQKTIRPECIGDEYNNLYPKIIQLSEECFTLFSQHPPFIFRECNFNLPFDKLMEQISEALFRQALNFALIQDGKKEEIKKIIEDNINSIKDVPSLLYAHNKNFVAMRCDLYWTIHQQLANIGALNGNLPLTAEEKFFKEYEVSFDESPYLVKTIKTYIHNVKEYTYLKKWLYDNMNDCFHSVLDEASHSYKRLYNGDSRSVTLDEYIEYLVIPEIKERLEQKNSFTPSEQEYFNTIFAKNEYPNIEEDFIKPLNSFFNNKYQSLYDTVYTYFPEIKNTLPNNQMSQKKLYRSIAKCIHSLYEENIKKLFQSGILNYRYTTLSNKPSYYDKNFENLFLLEQYMLSLRNTQSLPLNVSTDEFVDAYIKGPALKIEMYKQLFELIDIIIDYGTTRDTIINSFVTDLTKKIFFYYPINNTNISIKNLMREYQTCHLPAIINIYQQYMPQVLNTLRKKCANYQNSSDVATKVAEIESKINTALSILKTPLLQQGPLPQAPLPSEGDTSDNEKLFTQSLSIFETLNTVKEIRNKLKDIQSFLYKNADPKKRDSQFILIDPSKPQDNTSSAPRQDNAAIKYSDNNSEQTIDPALLQILKKIDLTILSNPVITIKESNVRDTCFLQIHNLFNIASLSIIFFYILAWGGSSINSTIFGT